MEVIARIEKYLQTGERYTRLDADIATLMSRARIAFTDPLTGVANRAGLTAEWPTLGVYDPVIALIDLDNFKPVNDRHGHAAGDLILVEVAARLATSGGRVIRLGGDEFVVILPMSLVAAMTVMGHIATLISTPVTLPGGVRVRVTASIGVYRCTNMDLGAALSCADSAMYRAKTLRLGVTAYHPRHDTHLFEHRPAVRRRDRYGDVT